MSWSAGNGVGLTWTSLISGSNELNSLANGSSCLLGVNIVNGGTTLDKFMDISAEFTVSSATPPAGASLVFYKALLLSDGSTYGSGELSLGGTLARAPALWPWFTIQFESSAAATLLCGGNPDPLVMPPGTFGVVLFNNTGAALSGTTANNVLKYRTYNG